MYESVLCAARLPAFVTGGFQIVRLLKSFEPPQPARLPEFPVLRGPHICSEVTRVLWDGTVALCVGWVLGRRLVPRR